MAKIRFPESNSISFWCLQDQSLPQSDKTRGNFDFDYPSIENPCEFINHDIDTPFWFQFRSDIESFTAYIINESGTQTDVISFITDGVENANNTTQYELYQELSAYDAGYYYYFITFTYEDESGTYRKLEYQSEWFNINSFDNSYVELKWRNGDFNPYNDGIVWSGTFQSIFIEGRLLSYTPISEKSVYVTENGKLKTTQVQLGKGKLLETELLPDFVNEKLNIIFGHDYYYFNDIRYNNEEVSEGERQGDTRLYSYIILLRFVEDQNGIAYEDYTDDPELTGEVTVVESGEILINDTDSLLINATDALLKS